MKNILLFICFSMFSIFVYGSNPEKTKNESKNKVGVCVQFNKQKNILSKTKKVERERVTCAVTIGDVTYQTFGSGSNTTEALNDCERKLAKVTARFL